MPDMLLFFRLSRLAVRHQRLFFWVLTALWQPAIGQIRLPHLVGDGMVLQRDTPISLWGWATPGEPVRVALNGQTGRTTTGTDGKWTVRLAAMKAGGPYQLSVRGSNEFTLTNILVGDVWVCSGQSNMELRVERVKERYAAVIAQATNPVIRHFLVPVRYNFQEPLADVPPGRWEAADPQTVLRFSAVGYFFARDLYKKHHVPIGLIEASAGGSPAEAWLSADALKAFPAHLSDAEKVKDSTYVKSTQTSETAATRQWYRQVYERDKGRHDSKSWAAPDYDASAWPTMQLPGYWEDAGVANGNGVVWFRRSVNVPAAMAGTPAKLWLGRIVDADSVFINGTFAGTTGYQYPPRRYDLPAGLLRPGKNTLVVRVINTTGKGGFVPDKPYELVAGGQTIDLKGPWQYQAGATTGPAPGTTFFQYKAGGLYNGMIAPLLNGAIKGVIWYQGESNTGRAKEYERLFPAVITNWRQQWQRTGAMAGDFPFLYVQLANFQPTTGLPVESQWAELREAQRKTLALPNTGMAVATDVGEWNDIHPLNKETVGKRLAAAAESVAYGQKKGVASGPLYQTMQRTGSKIILTFAGTGRGLVVNGGGKLRYFAIAGADNKFVWANAGIRRNQVVVWSDAVPNPVVVRYAWADNPQGANLYNKEGLPASPFTTKP